MLELLITSIFVIASLATVASLADTSARARNAFAALKHERALSRAGFVPMIEATEVRLRRPAAVRVVPATSLIQRRRLSTDAFAA